MFHVTKLYGQFTCYQITFDSNHFVHKYDLNVTSVINFMTSRAQKNMNRFKIKQLVNYSTPFIRQSGLQ